MKIESVKPTETTDTRGDIRRSHPAFGIISANRVSGGSATLYGSPLKHNGYIAIELQFSDEYVSFSHSHYWPAHRDDNGNRGTIAKVAMSEAQWAAFISTMNVGSGSPCTVEYACTKNFKRMPYIVDDSYAEKRSLDIAKVVAEQMQELKAAIAQFDKLLEQPTIKKSDLKDLRGMFRGSIESAASNTQFRADMLTEHSEKLVEAAKAEVSSMMMRMVMQYPQLEGQQVEIGVIEHKGSEK